MQYIEVGNIDAKKISFNNDMVEYRHEVDIPIINLAQRITDNGVISIHKYFSYVWAFGAQQTL